jgi:hypothetical protein
VTRVHDLGVLDNDWWIRADPVHLEPGRDRLILTAGPALDLSAEEADRLAAEIAETYATGGWLLKAPHPLRWYLKPPRPAQLQTTPLRDVIGRDIHPCLPTGPDAGPWRTLLNEIQILLHTARVNDERERAGKPPINSLWFWGSGRLPLLRPCGWRQLWSDEPVSCALARLAEVPTRPAPAEFREWKAAAGGEHLVVIETLHDSALYDDPTAWHQALERLDRHWLAPARAALGAGALARLTLQSDGGAGFDLDRHALRRWWRRRRPLPAYR